MPTDTAARPIALLLAGPHEPLRQSVRSILAGQPGLRIVAEASDAGGIMAAVAQTAPDLLLLDMEMPGGTGLEILRQVRAALPALKIVALAIHSDKRFVRETFKAGADGYILKYLAHEELVTALLQVASQGRYLSPSLADDQPEPFGMNAPHPVKTRALIKEVSMPYKKKVKDLMIPLEDYPHIPYWFTLRQAMAIVREAAIKFEGTFEPRAVLVFDEKYQLMGMLTLRDVVRGLEPRFAEDKGLIKSDPSLAVLVGDMFGPGMKEASQKPVSEVMSPIKVTVNGDDPITKALFLMIKENVGMMPVLQDNKVVGMVRMNELFKEISDVVLGD